MKTYKIIIILVVAAIIIAVAVLLSVKDSNKKIQKDLDQSQKQLSALQELKKQINPKKLTEKEVAEQLSALEKLRIPENKNKEMSQEDVQKQLNALSALKNKK